MDTPLKLTLEETVVVITGCFVFSDIDKRLLFTKLLEANDAKPDPVRTMVTWEKVYEENAHQLFLTKEEKFGFKNGWNSALSHAPDLIEAKARIVELEHLLDEFDGLSVGQSRQKASDTYLENERLKARVAELEIKLSKVSKYPNPDNQIQGLKTYIANLEQQNRQLREQLAEKPIRTSISFETWVTTKRSKWRFKIIEDEFGNAQFYGDAKANAAYDGWNAALEYLDTEDITTGKIMELVQNNKELSNQILELESKLSDNSVKALKQTGLEIVEHWRSTSPGIWEDIPTAEGEWKRLVDLIDANHYPPQQIKLATRELSDSEWEKLNDETDKLLKEAAIQDSVSRQTAINHLKSALEVLEGERNRENHTSPLR